MILVAPTEPLPMTELGATSAFPERYGADVLWSHKGAFIGVQRKAYPDLLASLHDGRLAREIAQMQRLAIAVLIIEGKPQWTLDGALMPINGRVHQWNRHQHRNLVHSVQSHGIWVDITDSVRDTIACVRDLHQWVAKDKHESLMRRPGPVAVWGKANSHEYQLHFLQGLEGVGPELAARLLEHFNGMPIGWLCDKQQLQEVRGVGAKRADQLWSALMREDTE